MDPGILHSHMCTPATFGLIVTVSILPIVPAAAAEWQLSCTAAVPNRRWCVRLAARDRRTKHENGAWQPCRISMLRQS